MAKGFGFHVDLVSRRAKRASAFRCSSSRAWSAPRGSKATATSIRRASPTAYAAGARAGGVRIVQNVRVTALERRGRRVTRVVTDHGAIDAECVINAAGMWGREIAAMVGTRVAACAVEHQYFVTEKTDRDSRRPADAARSRRTIST